MPRESSAEERMTAVAQAHTAFRQLRTSASDERSRWLMGIAEALEEHRSGLVSVADEETSLGTGRLNGELDRTVYQLRHFRDAIAQESHRRGIDQPGDPDASPQPRPSLKQMRVPLGPVAVWGASNFPFAFGVLGGDTASALAAGCPVIAVEHPGHPRTSELLAEIAQGALAKCDTPRGTFALLAGRATGASLIADAQVKAGAFTGSYAGGRALFDIASSRPDPIPFFAEMGSVNPVFITRQAVRQRGGEIAQGLVDSATLGVGQFCTKPGLVFVADGVEFVSMVEDRVVNVAPAPMLTEAIAANYRRRRSEMTDNSTARVSFANASSADELDGSAAVLVIDHEALKESWSVLSDECFGPLMVIVTCDSDSDLVDWAQQTPGSLTATIHASEDDASDRVVVNRLVDELQDSAGRIIFNGWPTGVAVSEAMHHGGPHPATMNPIFTSVGAQAIDRFLKPVTMQGFPDELVPSWLRGGTPPA